MTDREKIVELLEQIDAVSYERSKTETGFMIIKHGKEYIADYLLSHGVTVKEPNRVLTLEETTAAINRVRDKLYIEDKEYPHNTGYDEFGVVNLWTSNPKNREEYGKTWRCWAKKPTEEERKGAEWLE